MPYTGTLIRDLLAMVERAERKELSDPAPCFVSEKPVSAQAIEQPRMVEQKLDRVACEHGYCVRCQECRLCQCPIKKATPNDGD